MAKKTPKYKWAVAVYRLVDGKQVYVGVVSKDNTPSGIRKTGVIWTDVTSDNVKLLTKKADAEKYEKALNDDPELLGKIFKYYLPTQGVV